MVSTAIELRGERIKQCRMLELWNWNESPFRVFLVWMRDHWNEVGKHRIHLRNVREIS
jgi:hypothetical protein